MDTLGIDPLVDRPSLLLWLAESAPETGGERLWRQYVGELRIQPVGHPDSSDGRALVRFSRGPGFDSWSGYAIFPTYTYNLYFLFIYNDH